MRFIHLHRILLLAATVGALTLGVTATAHASVEDDLVAEVNKIRATSVTWDATLATAAQTQADTMTAATHSSYVRPGWITGENVAWAPGTDAATVVAAWTASSSHSLIQLGTQFTHAGAGYNPDGAFVIIFGAAVHATPPTPESEAPENPGPVGPPPPNTDEPIEEEEAPPVVTPPVVRPPMVSMPLSWTITTEDRNTRVVETFPGGFGDPTGRTGIGSAMTVFKKTLGSTGVPSVGASVTSTKPVAAAVTHRSFSEPVVAPAVTPLTDWISSGSSSSRVAALGGTSAAAAAADQVAPSLTSAGLTVLLGPSLVSSVQSSSGFPLWALGGVLVAVIVVLKVRAARH